MKRSLVMLLVVALLAMMIPSFALAATENASVKVSFSAPTQAVELVRGGDMVAKEWAELKAEGLADDAAAYFVLTTSDASVTGIQAVMGIWGSQSIPLNHLIWDHGVEGKATITATLYNNDKASKIIGEPVSIEVTVTKKAITEIKLDSEEYTVRVNGRRQHADATVKPDDSYYGEWGLLYSVADESIARVDATGEIIGVGEGTTTLTVADPDGKAPAATAKINVMAEAPEQEVSIPRLSFTTKNFTLKNSDADIKYRSFDFADYLKIDNFDWEYDDLVWVSSDPEIVTIYPQKVSEGLDEDGNPKYHFEAKPSFYKPGKATITVRSTIVPSASAKCEVTYEVEPLKSVTFTGMPEAFDEVDEFYFGSYVTTDPTYYVNENYWKRIEWKSSDVQVATVSGYTLKTHKAGEATITAYFEGEKVGELKVKVVAKPVTEAKFAKEEYTIKTGEPLYLANPTNLILTPDDHSAVTITWETSDDNIAPVTGGYVGGKMPGTAVITATITNTDNTVVTATTKVTVKPIEVKSVTFSKKYQDITIPLYEVEAGSTYETDNEFDVVATINPTNAYYETKWESSDVYVASVKETTENSRFATIRARHPGTCVVTLTVDDGVKTTSASINVTVKAANVVDLRLNKKQATVYLLKGADNTLQLTAYDKKSGEEVPVKWTSSDKKVATVNKYGVVKFLKAGKVNITATTKDGNATTATCKLTIKKLKVKSITPAKKAIKMKVGQEKVLKVKVLPEKAFNPRLNMLSSNSKVVTVDNDGNLVALKEGTAEITITTKDGTKKQTTVTVTVAGYAAENEVEEIEDSVIDITVEGEVIDDLGDFDDLLIEEDGEVTLD